MYRKKKVRFWTLKLTNFSYPAFAKPYCLYCNRGFLAQNISFNNLIRDFGRRYVKEALVRSNLPAASNCGRSDFLVSFVFGILVTIVVLSNNLLILERKNCPFCGNKLESHEGRFKDDRGISYYLITILKSFWDMLTIVFGRSSQDLANVHCTEMKRLRV